MKYSPTQAYGLYYYSFLNLGNSLNISRAVVLFIVVTTFDTVIVSTHIS